MLKKAGLQSLNEMVACASAVMAWKAKMKMDPPAKLLFCNQMKIERKISTRSTNSDSARLPVPVCNTLAANLLARAWNEIPKLQTSISLNAAKLAAKNWARSLKI